MAVTHTETVGTTDYGFDFEDQEIEVEAGVTEVDTADLKTACRQAEASVAGIVWPDIVDTANPVTLTASSSTFQVVILLDLWKILTLSTSGTFTVGSGNTVHTTDGIDIFAPNLQVSTINNISAAGVQVETGVSGLTAAEAAQLLEVWQDLGLDVNNAKTITENTADTSYDESVGSVTKEIRQVGSTTTVTRQP